MKLGILTPTAILLLLGVMWNPAVAISASGGRGRGRVRVVISRECMTTAQYWKEDCDVQGTLLHCKDIWIEFTCEQFRAQK